jgi:serine/threonine-protein kinase
VPKTGQSDPSRDELHTEQSRKVAFGQYELIKRIARGGMAEIFLAIEHGIEGVTRQVVVKRILPQMAESDDFLTMFMDEARVVARLSHPNIVHIYNFGEVDGVYFIAMELVEGLTVTRLQRLSRPRPLPIEFTLRVIGDICAGLHAAHELRDEHGRVLGVIHRDVSPQNIMVSKDGLAKLLDFGVARATTQSHATQAGQIKGKLGYIAPEQFHRKVGLDRRADVFSAGAVLYEMVTGERLFVRESEAATLNAILYEDVPSVVGRPGVPDEVDSVIRRATQKNPAERFSSAHEMQQALEELIIDLGLVVSPYLVGQFVVENIRKASENREAADARISSENLLPSSYPSETGRQLTPSWPVSSSSRMRRDPTLPPGAANPPSAQRISTEPSLSIPAGTAPLAAWDLPQARRGRGLWLAVIGAGVALIAAVVVLVAVVFDSPGGEGPAEGGAVARSDQGRHASKIRPVPIDPADLVPASSSPHAQPVADPRAPEGDASPPPEATTKTTRPTIVRPQGKGTLFLNTRPWSKVTIDGRDHGTTPLIDVELPAGSHAVRLTDADGVAHSRRVKIVADQATKVFYDLGQAAAP